MDSLTLYRTGAWWRMKSQDDRPDASSDGAKGRDPTPLPAPFEPPVRDPGVRALLKGLQSSATPEPMQIPTTDGESSASFAGAPREVPLAMPTPAPEARVVVDPNAPVKKTKRKPSRDQLVSTFRNRPRQGLPLVPIAAAGVVVLGVLVWVMKTRDARDGGGSVDVPPAHAPASAPARVESIPEAKLPVAAQPGPTEEAPLPTAAVSAASGAAPASSAPKPPRRSDIDPGATPF